MAQPAQATQQQAAAGGRNDEPQDASSIDVAAAGGVLLNDVGGGLAETAVDVPPGQGGIQDLPGDHEHLSKLAGDVGTVKGPGLGSVQGGVDERGGVGAAAPDVAAQSDTSRLHGSSADE